MPKEQSAPKGTLEVTALVFVPDEDSMYRALNHELVATEKTIAVMECTEEEAGQLVARIRAKNSTQVKGRWTGAKLL